MSELTKHYRQLLGLDAAWEVLEVDLCVEEKRVEILVTHVGGPVACPECEGVCSIADHAPERTWRHLDTMQFETRLRARTPRANCSTCGIKTITIPWQASIRVSRCCLKPSQFEFSKLVATSKAQPN